MLLKSPVLSVLHLALPKEEGHALRAFSRACTESCKQLRYHILMN